MVCTKLCCIRRDRTTFLCSVDALTSKPHKQKKRKENCTPLPCLHRREPTTVAVSNLSRSGLAYWHDVLFTIIVLGARWVSSFHFKKNLKTNWIWFTAELWIVYDCILYICSPLCGVRLHSMMMSFCFLCQEPISVYIKCAIEDSSLNWMSLLRNWNISVPIKLRTIWCPSNMLNYNSLSEEGCYITY